MYGDFFDEINMLEAKKEEKSYELLKLRWFGAPIRTVREKTVVTIVIIRI